MRLDGGGHYDTDIYNNSDRYAGYEQSIPIDDVEVQQST